MKKALLVLVCLIVMALLSTVAVLAEVAPSMTLRVPFAFYAGQYLLPAGEYIIEMPQGGTAGTGSMIAVRTRDGSVIRMLQTLAAVTGDKKPAHHVIFTKYDATYFLSKVQNGSFEASVPKTWTEKRMALLHSAGSVGVGGAAQGN